MNEQTLLEHPKQRLLSRSVDGFDSLAELALDMRSSWNHDTESIWRQLDPVLWELTQNPWVVLQTTSREKLHRVLADPAFRKDVEDLVKAMEGRGEGAAWFQQSHSQSVLNLRRLFQHGIYAQRSVYPSIPAG